MKVRRKIFMLLFFCIYLVSSNTDTGDPSTAGKNSGNLSRKADHSVVNFLRLGKIPLSAIQNAKSKLHIAYGHTSHGSQLITGMNGLIAFANAGGLRTAYPKNLFRWNRGGRGGALDLREGDGYGRGAMKMDCGYYPDWVNETRKFLNNPANSDINVVMWSWCGQAGSYSEKKMNKHYLLPMNLLETEYPGVKFVYMTGHLNGSGLAGTLHRRNEQIRNYCSKNNKWLFDFADIETYDPDLNYFGDKIPDDGCNYDSNNDGSRDKNWAAAWQNKNPGKWYNCESAHSEPLNANQKAYAVWWLFCRLAGWNGK